jgi:hypothetical protein
MNWRELFRRQFVKSGKEDHPEKDAIKQLRAKWLGNKNVYDPPTSINPEDGTDQSEPS